MKTLSIRWAAVLLAALVLSPASGSAQRSPAAGKAVGEFAIAFEKEDWPQAIKLGELLVEQQPRNHVHPYNLACAYARSGNVDQALAWLERAAERGFSNPQGVQKDEDLASLRQEARFAWVVEQIEANYDRARALFADLAKGSEAVVVAPPLEPEDGTDNKEAKPLPVLLLLHGYGDSTDTFSRVFEGFAAREGYLLVGVRSVVPASPDRSGRAFEWATPVDTQTQIRSALAQAAALYPLDERRIYLLGFSQGGRMALEAAAVEDVPYTGVIVVGAPVRKGLEEELPADAPPIFLMVGGDDGPATSARKGAKALKKAGHRVELRVYPGVAHAFPSTWESELRHAIRWFESLG